MAKLQIQQLNPDSTEQINYAKQQKIHGGENYVVLGWPAQVFDNYDNNELLRKFGNAIDGIRYVETTNSAPDNI